MLHAMKKIAIILFSALFSLVISCKKDPEAPTGGNKILLGITTPDTVSYLFAKVSTQLNGTGGNQITQHGHCWSVVSGPDIGDDHTSLGRVDGPGKVTSDISGLSDNKKYFIRPYFTTFQGITNYGSQKEIITLKRGKPVAITGVTTDITTSSAKISGSATFDSGFAIIQKGVCWDTIANPTLQKSIGHSAEGAGTGAFISSTPQLADNKQYYFCAYATNERGTSYGESKHFTTVPIYKPTVSTSNITNITQTTATSGGNVTADGGATVTTRGVCWSVSSNPTNANSHTTNSSGTGTFVSNLTNLTPNTLHYIRAYATNSVGTAYGNQVSFTTANLCGSSITISHVAGSVAPVSKTVTYGTIANIPGETSKCWITSNLGADNQATAANDASEASAGWYWQFNRKQGYKHDGTTRTPNTTWIPSISENYDWTTINDPCSMELGTGWRLPTLAEWANVDASGNWTNWNGTWNTALKMHAAGYLSDSGSSLNDRGSSGFYWSSTQDGAANGWNLYFSSGYSYMNYYYKAYGFSTRCLRDF